MISSKNHVPWVCGNVSADEKAVVMQNIFMLKHASNIRQNVFLTANLLESVRLLSLGCVRCWLQKPRTVGTSGIVFNILVKNIPRINIVIQKWTHHSCAHVVFLMRFYRPNLTVSWEWWVFEGHISCTIFSGLRTEISFFDKVVLEDM